MQRLDTPAVRISDTELARCIARWVRHAPKRMLVELHDDNSGDEAALALGEFIAAEITMAYPELCEPAAPRFDF